MGEKVKLVSLYSLMPSGLKKVGKEITLVSSGLKDQGWRGWGEEQVLLTFARLSNDQISLQDSSGSKNVNWREPKSC